MGRTRGWTGALLLALLLLGAVACSGDGGGDSKSAPTTSPPSSVASAPNAGGTATPQDLTQLAQNVVQQLEQATTGEGGAPRAVTREEVDAILRAQTEQLLNQTPKKP